MKTNSLNKRTNQILVKASRAETTLMDLANIYALPPLGTVVTPHAIAGVATDHRHIDSMEKVRKRYPDMFERCSDVDMFALRHLLQQAWKSPDLRSREWFVFLLRRFHAETMRQALEDPESVVPEWRVHSLQVQEMLKKDKPAQWIGKLMKGERARAALKDGPPSQSEFEDIAFHLQRHLSRALYCLNPTCPAPHFFVKQKGQRYCSPACAEYGQRTSKKKWWQENRGKGRD